MRLAILIGTAGIPAAALAAVLALTPAHASQPTPAAVAPAAAARPSPVDESWSATCTTLGENLTGDVYQDTSLTLGIAMAISTDYGVTQYEGVRIENSQV